MLCSILMDWKRLNGISKVGRLSQPLGDDDAAARHYGFAREPAHERQKEEREDRRRAEEDGPRARQRRYVRGHGRARARPRS